MMASGEIRLSGTMPRQMPVLAQSPTVVNNWLSGNFGSDPTTGQTLDAVPALNPGYFNGQTTTPADDNLSPTTQSTSPTMSSFVNNALRITLPGFLGGGARLVRIFLAAMR